MNETSSGLIELAGAYNPEHITDEAIQVIANHSPAEVSNAVAAVQTAYTLATHEAWLSGRVGEQLSRTHQTHAGVVQETHRSLRGMAEDEAQRAQDRLGMVESVGYYPSGNDMSLLDTALYSIAAEDERVAKEMAELEEAGEEVVGALVNSANATLATQELEQARALALEVNRQQKSLGRRGRWATRIAGLALGAGLGLGIGMATSLDHEVPEASAINGAAAFATVAAAGAIASNRLNGRFARRAARRQLAKQQ